MISALLLTASLTLAADESPPDGQRMNVLFIAVDDLKPTLGCYGDAAAVTPNIDALAAAGTAFTSAYCQQAVCNPSRASLMTGLRPDTMKVYDLQTNFRDTAPSAVTIGEHLIKEGFHSQGYGKIFHAGHGLSDDTRTWSEKGRNLWTTRYGPETQQRIDAANKAKRRANGGRLGTNNRVRGPAYEAPVIADEKLQDGEVAVLVGDLIRKHAAAAKSGEQPFFLAAGFKNPHLPFVAPKRYWDLHDPAKFDVPEAATAPPAVPEDAPSYAKTGWGELRAYEGMPGKGPVTAEQARTLTHGYYAATSYIDAQVGKLLKVLDEEGLRESTVVVLWGDHGWHLGDHGFWCKHTNYEQATRVPLIVSAPGQKVRGETCEALVEFVDVFPTLTDLCGVATPEGLAGQSLRPLLDDPTLEGDPASFHLYPRGGRMGRAVRTKTHRLVRWTARRGGAVDAVELYDLASDPGETRNVAEGNEALVDELWALWPE